MSTVHAHDILAALNKGTDGSRNLDYWLFPFATALDVLAITADYKLAPEDSYCPCADIPDYAAHPGIWYSHDKSECWVVIDNGMCIAGFKLVRGL